MVCNPLARGRGEDIVLMNLKSLRLKGNLLLAVSAGLCCPAAVCMVLFPAISLGIPGEWVWPKRDAGLNEIFFLFLYEVPVFLALCGLAGWLERAGKCRKIKTMCLAIFLLLGVLHYSIVVWDSGPGRRGENIVAFLDTFTGAYLGEAARVEKPNEFFAGYAEKMSRREDPGNHLDVHPPGNVYFSWLVLEFARTSPAARSLETWLASEDVRIELEALIRRYAGPTLVGEPAARTAAVLLLGLSDFAVFGGLLAILAAFFLLAGKSSSSSGLLWGAVFCIYSCGGPILFCGHFDTFMFFLGGVCCLSIAATMTAKRPRIRLTLALLTGVLLAVAMSCSLAFVAMILLAGAGFLLCGRRIRNGVYAASACIAGGLLFVGFVWLFARVNLFACCWYASRNNTAFFHESGRSLVAWWPYNLLDMALFCGISILLLMGMGIHPFHRVAGKWTFRRTARSLFGCLAAGIMLLVLVSPFSRGEMGRLMLFFMPCCLLAALPVLNALLRAGCSRLLLSVALLSNVFLVFVIRLTLKLVIGY